MKTLIVTATLAAAFVGLQTAAEAQRPSAYRYCLIEYLGPRGGGGTILCRFNTLAQCLASRSGPSDSCFINPEYSGRR